NQIGPKRPRQKPVHLHFKSKNGSLIHMNGQETMTLKTMIQALAELRMDTIRHRADEQAAFLAGHLREVSLYDILRSCCVGL
ncbi:MAG: hypothetical protein WCJ40_19520, partial [Planctomycetota bacterium]